MTETLAHGYSSDSTQQERSNKYTHDRVKMGIRKSWRPKSSLSIERVKPNKVILSFEKFSI